jgi:signal transduction histidine kinase/FixJ family two-component response regulator
MAIFTSSKVSNLITEIVCSHPKKHQNIKIRLLPPLMIAICFLQGVFIFTFSSNQKKRILETQEVTTQRTQDLLREAMRSDTDKMSAALDAIVRDRQMMESFRARDREALLKRAKPLFERLKKQHQITNFYFHQPDRVIFLRVHKNLYGDLINRATLKNAQTTGKPTSGLEQGVTGSPVLRVVYPWRSDYPTRLDSAFFEQPWQGDLVGFVELGIEFEDIAKNVSKILDTDLIILADKRFLDRQQWESRNKKLGRESEWDDFPNAVIIDKTVDKIDQPLAEAIAKAKTSGFQRTMILSQDGKSIQVTFLPLLDLNGKNLGNVIALKDITAIVKAAEQSILETSIICLLIAGTLGSFFYILIGRVERDLVERTEKLAEAKSALEKNNEILEHRVAERTTELQQAKNQADSANQAKSEFLANMSHELRTPLNGILGYAQILGRSKALPGKERHGVNIIHQCGSHLLNLINDVLDLSKIEARKLELTPKAIHFPSFLQGVVEICQIRADQKGIDFHYEPAANLPTGIAADEKRLRQVLINLLGNAIKFTDKGSVTLRVEQLSLDTNSTRLRFLVADTGVGIAPEHVNKLFQAFEQVGDKTRQAEGTGLGLAISQQIVQLMGGKIQVQSQIEMGSDFFFEVELPLALNWSQQQTSLANNIMGYEGARRQILVVDDRWENRAVLVSLLSPLGFIVTEAEDGQDGLNRLHHQLPDLVITDLVMPVIDGFEMLKQLRNNEKLKSLKVLVSSASVSQLDQQMSLAAGGDDFLAKPVQAEELFQLIAQHLQLTWVYEETTPDTPSDAATTEFVPPPFESLQQLLELAQKGRLKQVKALAEQIGQQDDRYQPFVQKILDLAKQFQTEQVEQLIQSYLVSSNAI